MPVGVFRVSVHVPFKISSFLSGDVNRVDFVFLYTSFLMKHDIHAHVHVTSKAKLLHM